jgi:hypothetical protein
MACKGLATLDLRPVFGVRVNRKVPQATLQEMLRNQSPGDLVILHDVGEWQLGPAQGEVHGRPLYGDHKLRQLVVRR